MSYDAVTDDEALAAFSEVCRLEGIIPALEPRARARVAVRQPATVAELDL